MIYIFIDVYIYCIYVYIYTFIYTSICCHVMKIYHFNLVSKIIFYGHIWAFLTPSRPLHGHSRPPICHGQKKFSTATFLENGRRHGHLATLVFFALASIQQERLKDFTVMTSGGYLECLGRFSSFCCILAPSYRFGSSFNLFLKWWNAITFFLHMY
jgi:hypothetical protein